MSETELKNNQIELRDTSSVPSIFEDGLFSEVFPASKLPVLFLDFDGTLSPIVKQPEDASISEEMKKALENCAAYLTVAVVSGRDMDDVKKRVGLDNVIYAGSHGFRIEGPDGLSMEHGKTKEILPGLDDTEEKLQELFAGGPKGVKVERKRYAIAVHYRNADENKLDEIKSKINEVLADHPEVKTGKGKKIIEVKPDIDWHKGKAIKWILETLNLLDKPEILPVYIGDDVTDEDAFKVLYYEGVGILVGSHGQKTVARYKLNNVNEVKELLERIRMIREK
ncbi:MAG: trehalose-phosphatase [Bacteroidota bacterium]